MCGVQSGGDGRRKGPGVCHFLRERGGRRPGMRAAGPGGSAHCEREGRRGAEGPGSEGGARLPGAGSAVAAASPPLRRRSPAGGWARGGGGRAGGRRGAAGAAAAAAAGCSTRACVRRRHAHTCPPPLPAASLAARAERARLNFPFILGLRWRARRWQSSPRRLRGRRAASCCWKGASPRGVWTRWVVAAGCASEGLECPGLSL